MNYEIAYIGLGLTRLWLATCIVLLIFFIWVISKNEEKWDSSDFWQTMILGYIIVCSIILGILFVIKWIIDGF
jgi:hypothetical protein